MCRWVGGWVGLLAACVCVRARPVAPARVSGLEAHGKPPHAAVAACATAQVLNVGHNTPTWASPPLRNGPFWSFATRGVPVPGGSNGREGRCAGYAYRWAPFNRIAVRCAVGHSWAWLVVPVCWTVFAWLGFCVGKLPGRGQAPISPRRAVVYRPLARTCPWAKGSPRQRCGPRLLVMARKVGPRAPAHPAAGHRDGHPAPPFVWTTPSPLFVLAGQLLHTQGDTPPSLPVHGDRLMFRVLACCWRAAAVIRRNGRGGRRDRPQQDIWPRRDTLGPVGPLSFLSCGAAGALARSARPDRSALGSSRRGWGVGTQPSLQRDGRLGRVPLHRLLS